MGLRAASPSREKGHVPLQCSTLEGTDPRYVVAYTDDWLPANLGEGAHSANSRSLGVFQHVAREEQTVARPKLIAMLRPSFTISWALPYGGTRLS